MSRDISSAFDNWEKSAQDSSQEMLGVHDAPFAGANRNRVIQIGIFETYPDPAQPRRAIPASVRGTWRANPDEMTEFLRHWADCAGIDIGVYLADDPDFERPEHKAPVETALVGLIDLALSIKRDGLSNPITVSRRGGKYFIETGERRWVAYHLLHHYDRDGDWKMIPARDVGDHNVWRQAAENGARADLNAVGQARQLALLLMDLLGREHFAPIESFDTEQAFYAQVADGDLHRIPRGAGQHICSVMGLKNQVQIRQLRSVLRVPGDFWHFADENDLTEGEIRKAAKNGYTVTGVTVSLEKLQVDNPSHSFDFGERKREFSKMITLLTRVEKGDERARENALGWIDEQRRWLSLVEKWLRDKE